MMQVDDADAAEPGRAIVLPGLDSDMLAWLEDWTPPVPIEGAPLTIAEKIFMALCLARIRDDRRRDPPA